MEPLREDMFPGGATAGNLSLCLELALFKESEAPTNYGASHSYTAMSKVGQ